MRLLTVLLLCLVTATAMPAGAQEFVPTPVEISKDKVNIEGRIYYIHKVLKGQTIYSITKAYGVSEAALMSANPGLKEGLKAGMLVYVPAAVSTQTAEPSAGQTAVQAGDIGKTAVTDKTDKTEKKKTDRKKYRKYNLKWYETLEDAAVKFSVPVEAIISLNGIDPESDRRIRTILIPDTEYISAMEQERTVLQDTVSSTDVDMTAGTVSAAVQSSDTETAGNSDTGIYDEDGYMISLVLPFNASILTDDMNAYAADFYAGALTAVYKLKEQGLLDHFKLNTVDLSAYGSAWEMVADGVLDDSELIIGPISERDLQPVASFAKSRRIPVVSPLDLKTAGLADGNPYFYLFPTHPDSSLSHQVDKIALKKDDVSVTVVYEQGYERSDMVVNTVKCLEQKGLPFKMFHYDFLSGRGIDQVLCTQLDSLRTNCVIIPSMSEAFITDALRNLNLIKSSGKFRVEVYGFSRWKSFETIEMNYFHTLDLRLATSYHIDYGSPETIGFIRLYKDVFNTEPTSFAFQGYDIMTFFITAMNEHGRNFPNAIINERKSLLQSDVLFLPVGPGSGYSNRAFKDVCFTDGWKVVTE